MEELATTVRRYTVQPYNMAGMSGEIRYRDTVEVGEIR